MFPKPFTPTELLAIVERLTPAKLFMRTPAEAVDADIHAQLHAIVFRDAVDPKLRMENVEYLLLLMHKALALDPKVYLMQVFLPWVALRSRVASNRERVGLEFARMSEFDDDPQQGAAHAAVSIYRPMVADILDPYLTLLVATYQVIDGEFTSIEVSNLGAGERNKAELIESRIKRTGGPERLLAGYDPLVRNALSHIGSDGIRVEADAIVFRNIKRTSPPVVEVRRWSHDELYTRTLAIVELVSSIDAAINVFGSDCGDLLAEDPTLRGGVIEYALTAEQRAKMRIESQAVLEVIRKDPGRPLQQKVEELASYFHAQLAANRMDPADVAFDANRRAFACRVKTLVPIDATNDVEFRDRAMIMIRYLVEARRMFGDLFETFVAVEEAGGEFVRSAWLSVAALDDYIAEQAGLFDLLQEVEITQGGGVFAILMDEDEIRVAEDAGLGQRYPRRGRPLETI